MERFVREKRFWIYTRLAEKEMLHRARPTKAVRHREGFPCLGVVQDLGFRWGPCGKNDRVNFHQKTILLPPRTIEYVIVHELVHLTEAHHTPAFWTRVERAMPDFAARTIRCISSQSFENTGEVQARSWILMSTPALLHTSGAAAGSAAQSLCDQRHVGCSSTRA
jgi:hypothetical protein